MMSTSKYKERMKKYSTIMLEKEVKNELNKCKGENYQIKILNLMEKDRRKRNE